MVVVGDGRGKVGWGYGKANEVPPSVEKAIKDGARKMVEVPIDDGTIPHTVEGHFGASHVILVPASPGTGVIAGAASAPSARRPAFTTFSPRASARRIPPIWSRPRSPRSSTAHATRRGAAARSFADMNLNDVNRGIHKHKKRKRVGRGPGSGHGKTSGRGHKGQGQLAGWTSHPCSKGAQMPLVRRIPKRGFNNRWARIVTAVNVGELNEVFAAGDEVTLEIAARAGLVKGRFDVLKILGDGELTKKLKISAHRSASRPWRRSRKPAARRSCCPGPPRSSRAKRKKKSSAQKRQARPSWERGFARDRSPRVRERLAVAYILAGRLSQRRRLHAGRSEPCGKKFASSSRFPSCARRFC